MRRCLSCQVFFGGHVRHTVRAFQGHLVCQAHLKSRDYGAAVCDAALVLQTRNDAKATRGLVESWSHCNAFCWSVAAHAAPGLGQIQPSLERPLIRFMNSSFWADESPDECSLFLFISCYFMLFLLLVVLAVPIKSRRSLVPAVPTWTYLNCVRLESRTSGIASGWSPPRSPWGCMTLKLSSKWKPHHIACPVESACSLQWDWNILKWDQAEVMEWRAVTKAAVKAAIDYAAQGSGVPTPLWKGWEDLGGPLNLRKVEMSKCQTIWVKLLFYIVVYCINK